MGSSGNKTVANDMSVEEFVASLGDAQQAEDTRTLLEIFRRVTGKQPAMWGSSMIGYGKLNLTYASGREVEWFSVGFSPRKGKLTLYVTFDADALTRQFPKLGTHKTGKGCIYITRLASVDLAELEKLIATAHTAGWQGPERTDGKEQTLHAVEVE